MDYLGFCPNDDRKERILTDDVLHRFYLTLCNIFGHPIEFSVSGGYDGVIKLVSAGFDGCNPLFYYAPLDNYLELLGYLRAWPKGTYEKVCNAIMEYLVNEENVQNQRR